MIFEHQRFEIWNLGQHPYKHSLGEFSYSNPALPGVVNVEQAMNWMLAVLYPNAKAAVADYASLPLLGNTLNDYRVVLDDGDGKAASYRWEQREGDVAPKWYKVMDMDWSTDSLLEAYLDVSQDLFVLRQGRQDTDDLGAVITGLYAGQTIYGGTQANQNLTLRANSGDGVGPSTGFVQIDDHFRPTADASFDLSTLTERWRNGYFSNSVEVGTLTLSSGSITDSSGLISFGNEDLTTTGTITGTNLVATTQATIGTTLVISSGLITDTSGNIGFDNENLSTTGTLASGTHTISSDLVLAAGSITSVGGTIDFDNENLITTGTFQSGDAQVTRLDSDNIRIDGNTISALDLNGNINLLANGTGVIDAQSALTTLDITATGIVTVTGQLNADNLRLDGNVLSSTSVNGNVTLQPNGSGVVETTSDILPSADISFDLGSLTKRFVDIFLTGNINDGATALPISTLMLLTNITGASVGDALFWDGTKWTPSNPDSEILHSEISGLLADDHTQYALLAGRLGGQTLIGGTGASNNLVLQSTSHATRGAIVFADDLEPENTAVFSGSWAGVDLGSSAKYFNDLYMRGEAKNLRIENFTFATLPASSAQNIGRIMYATDTQKAYIDTGTAVKVLGVSKFVSDTAWNGTDTTKDINVSADIQDARNAIWALHDNANDFDRIYCSIKAISATTVRITVSPALPAGSYRLLGIE